MGRIKMMKHGSNLLRIGVVAAILCLLPAGACSARPKPSAVLARDQRTGAGAIAEEFRRRIPDLMRRGKIPGLAVALVDRDGLIWAEGFGYTDYDRKTPVTTETIFSIQSMSKTFTATAAMLAAQEGLVDLDAPITAYLPDFKVNSVFEEHPERKITLRHLLSHTAGFTHEAPTGNNYDLGRPGFDEHIASISTTWLRFPVGENYAYSNLGIDLAGYIVQVRSGLPFPDYVRTRLLGPLGMDRTTCDPARIAREDNRAVGHSDPLRRLPLHIPIIPSGGIYTSARDLAAFVRFHLNRGRAGGRQLLAESWLARMYAVPEPGMGPDGGYALGIGRFLRRGTYGYGHGGGGFGFLSDMYWYPELGLGAVVLTNSTGHQLQGQLVFELLDALLDEPGTVYHRRLGDLPPLNPAEYTTPVDRQAKLTWNVRAHLLTLAPRATAARQAAWRGYIGNYRYRVWGQSAGLIRVRRQEGGLTLDERELIEVRPGLFFTLDGEALDLRGQVPTWRNIKLTRITIPLWQWALLALGVLLLPVLLFLRPLFLRRGRSAATSAGRGLGRTALIIAGLNAVLHLILLGVLAFYPFLIFEGLPGWYPEMPVLLQALVLIPPAVAVLTAGMAVLVVLAWRGQFWIRAGKVHYAMMTLGAVLLVALMGIWRIL